MIKGLFNFIFGLIRLALLVLVLAVIFHAWVIKQALVFSLSYQLGADVSAQHVKMDWKNTGIEVQGLEIGNPYSFPKGTLADIPLVIISVDLPSIPQGLLKLKTVGFDLRELQVMNVPKKGLNLLGLKPFQEKDGEDGSSSPQDGSRTAIRRYAPKVVVDELIFSIGEISYLDMSGPSLKQNRYQAGIRGATYYDIRGTKDITVIVVTEALKKMGFSYLESQIQKLQGRYIPQASKPSNFFSRVASVFKGESSDHS